MEKFKKEEEEKEDVREKLKKEDEEKRDWRFDINTQYGRILPSAITAPLVLCKNSIVL
jgi:hypothetical protein